MSNDYVTKPLDTQVTTYKTVIAILSCFVA